MNVQLQRHPESVSQIRLLFDDRLNWKHQQDLADELSGISGIEEIVPRAYSADIVVALHITSLPAVAVLVRESLLADKSDSLIGGLVEAVVLGAGLT